MIDLYIHVSKTGTIRVDDKTKYTNELGKEVRIEKRFNDLTNTLEEDYFENGNLIHRTYSENGEYKARHYFAFSVDQMNQLVDKIPTISIIYTTRTNGYEIEEAIDFVDKVIMEKRIFVTDKFCKNICFRLIQFENGAAKLSSTEKKYYEEGSLKYIFDYNPDGTCFMIENCQTYQEDIFAWDIGTDKTNFTWKGFEYYQFADPLVPEEQES